MARPPPDPELVDLVLRALRSGTSHAEVARLAHVSPGTIATWMRKYAGGGGACAKRLTPEIQAAVSTEPSEPPTPDDIDTSTLGIVDRAVREQLEVARGARTVGNMGAAQRALRDVVGLANTKARLERQQAAARDGLHITREELAAARRVVALRIKALLDRPLLCAHCNRALSLAWAESVLDTESAPLE